MCYIQGKSKLKEATGYKFAVVDKESNIYSSTTGIKYEVGNVKTIPYFENRESAESYYDEYVGPIYKLFSPLGYDIFLNYGCFYHKDLVGKTAAFVYRRDAEVYKPEDESISDEYKIVIIQVTFKGDIYLGEYGICKIIAGDYIDKIEICA